MCEAFGCRPSEAEQELDENGDLVMDILDLRAYARAFHAYQSMGSLSDKAKRDLLNDKAVQAVQKNESDLVQEASGGLGHGDGGTGHADAGPRTSGG